MGSLKPRKDEVQEVQGDFFDYRYESVGRCDSLGIMEGKEWVWDNGILKEQISEIKNRNRKPKKDREQTLVKGLEDFMNKL